MADGRGPPALSLGSAPKVDFRQLRDFQENKEVERDVPGGPNFTRLAYWLKWAAEDGWGPEFAAMYGKLFDLKAGHAGWDRNKDIELVQAHADVTVQRQEQGREE